MTKRPGLNALSMFDAAARHLNFRKASEELNITQGAVAQQVRKLEAVLGVKLFVRNARGLSLSKQGLQYFTAVHEALSLIDQATDDLVGSQESLTISVTPSIASKWLVPSLPDFTAEYPEISVQVLASETLSDLENDGIDLAIRQGKKPESSRLEITRLAEISLIAVASKSYVEQGGRLFSSLEDFAELPLIQDGHRYWEQLFNEAGLVIKAPYLQFNQTALALDAAQNGQGIALVPEILARNSLQKEELTILWRSDHAFQNAGFYLLQPKSKLKNAASKSLAAWLIGKSAEFNSDQVSASR